MKTLSDKMILSSSPTIIKFADKKGKIIKIPARKCGQKMYLERDIKKSIKDFKEEIYEDDLLGWRNKKVLKHYSDILDKILGIRFAKKTSQSVHLGNKEKKNEK